MTTLDKVKEGETIKVNCIDCGQRIKHRLCSLGVMGGKEIKIVKNDGKGPIIIKVLDSKLAIGRGQAEKINCSC